MRPIIGIILDEVLEPPTDGSAFARRPFYALRMDYFDAVADAGGAPIATPYRLDALGDYLELCDGWIIPGGDYRFRPEDYAVPPPPALVRPTLRRGFEFAATAQILAKGAPLLGICNGAQVLAAATGGKIAFHGHGPRQGGAIAHGDPASGLARHSVAIAPGTRLADLYGAGARETNSAHKEDVVTVGPDVRVSARAEDGVIEAIELPGARFALGVQWHPELEERSPLFQALVDAARG